MQEGSAPSARYATTRDGVRIGYTISGDGPPLVFVRALNSHAEAWLTEPWTGRYFGALARRFSVVLFDARGNGLSDHVDHVDLDALVEDVRAVVTDAGLPRFTLFGQGFGSPVAIAYAARQAAQVERLILYCAYAVGAGVGIADEFIDTMRRMPDAAIALMGRLTYPDVRSLPIERMILRSFNTTPELGASYLEFARTVDVEALLAAVRAPTLVMQPERSPVVPIGLGRHVAAGIAGAQFVAVAGGSYNPWWEEAVEPTLRAIGEFTGMQLPTMPKPTRLAVLVTDIVGSTALTHRVGEEHARDVYRVHDDVVKDALAAHRGTAVKHTGDGVMASFESEIDAVACAVAIQEALSRRVDANTDDALEVRIGIAVGDVVVERGDLFGTTVVLAVRLNQRAKPGQILTSDAIRATAVDLFEFGPARSLALKGFPERVRVHELRLAPSLPYRDEKAKPS
jgi:class 3 adenylate cyclase